VTTLFKIAYYNFSDLRLDFVAAFEQPDVYAKEQRAEYEDEDHAQKDVDIRNSQNPIPHPVDHEK